MIDGETNTMAQLPRITQPAPADLDPLCAALRARAAELDAVDAWRRRETLGGDVRTVDAPVAFDCAT